MKDGYIKNDEHGSILIRTAYLISSYLGSVIHVVHCPRRSSWEASTADNFTRAKMTSFLEKTDPVTLQEPRNTGAINVVVGKPSQ
jgi:hypothetical protein